MLKNGVNVDFKVKNLNFLSIYLRFYERKINFETVKAFIDAGINVNELDEHKENVLFEYLRSCP